MAPTSQRPRATSYEYTWTSPHLFLTHSQIYLCLATFNAYITYQYDNDRTLQAICMLFGGTSGNYFRAACGRGLATPRLDAVKLGPISFIEIKML